MTLLQIKKLGRTRYKIYGKYYKKFLIYKIQNLVNDKVYIGLTTNLSKRLKSYLYHGNNGDGQQLIHRALKKYGLDEFDFEIIEEAESLELQEREKFWINFYNSNDLNVGYNLTNGGEKFVHNLETVLKMKKSSNNKIKVFLYDKMGNYIKQFESINECARELKRKHSAIVDAIKKQNLIQGKYLASFEKKDSVKPHNNLKSEKLKIKLKNNRNCITFNWKLVDNKNQKTYIADGIRKLSILSGYKEDILRSIAYGRYGYKEFKDYLLLTKLEKYEN